MLPIAGRHTAPLLYGAVYCRAVVGHTAVGCPVVGRAAVVWWWGLLVLVARDLRLSDFSRNHHRTGS